MSTELRSRINPDLGLPAGFLAMSPRGRVAEKVVREARLTERVEEFLNRLDVRSACGKREDKSQVRPLPTGGNIWFRPHRRVHPARWGK